MFDNKNNNELSKIFNWLDGARTDGLDKKPCDEIIYDALERLSIEALKSGKTDFDGGLIRDGSEVSLREFAEQLFTALSMFFEAELRVCLHGSKRRLYGSFYAEASNIFLVIALFNAITSKNILARH